MNPIRMIAAIGVVSMLILTSCGDNDRPPQEAFVLQNNTEWNVFIVSGRHDETGPAAFADGRGYSPRIEAGDSYRKTYGQSPDGQPGGCFGNAQMWAVRSFSDTLEHPGINDIVDVDDIDVLAHWPLGTCFTQDDQVFELAG